MKKIGVTAWRVLIVVLVSLVAFGLFINLHHGVG